MWQNKENGQIEPPGEKKWTEQQKIYVSSVFIVSVWTESSIGMRFVVYVWLVSVTQYVTRCVIAMAVVMIRIVWSVYHHSSYARR